MPPKYVINTAIDIANMYADVAYKGHHQTGYIVLDLHLQHRKFLININLRIRH
jgi:hypothetical protein